MSLSLHERIVLEELKNCGPTEFSRESMFYKAMLSCVKKGYAEKLDARVLGRVKITELGRKQL